MAVVGATFCMALTTGAITGSPQVSSSPPSMRAASRSRAASRRLRSSARCASRRSSAGLPIGFSKKSKAPCFIASTALSMLPWAVMTMTCTSG